MATTAQPTSRNGAAGNQHTAIQPPSELQDLGGGWVWVGDVDGVLGFDFARLFWPSGKRLTPAQVRRLAPFVVHAAWRRDLGPVLLIHGNRRRVIAALDGQWRGGAWRAWSPGSASPRHRMTERGILLALKRQEASELNAWLAAGALPWFEPGEPEFDTPRCVHEDAGGRRCGSPATTTEPYCDRHLSTDWGR